MKEKILKKGILQILLGFIFAFAMAFAFMPISSIKADAASTTYTLAQLKEGSIVKAGDVLDRGASGFGVLGFSNAQGTESIAFGMAMADDSASSINNIRTWTVKSSLPKYYQKQGTCSWYDASTEFIVAYVEPKSVEGYTIYRVIFVPVLGSISLNKTSSSIIVGNTETLAVTFNYVLDGLNISNKNITWKSDNTKVATVSNGVVTGVSAGTAKITATSAEGNYVATCTVTVHAHTYDTTKWTTDANNHWHAATCAHTTEKKDLGAHSGGTATCIAQAVCSVCNTPYGEYAPHVYGYSANGNVLTATCQTPGCTQSVSLDLTANDVTYTGSPVSASIADATAWEGANLTVPTIKYVGRDGTNYPESETAPTDVGAYTAIITVDSATATVDFNIHGHEFSYSVRGNAIVATCANTDGKCDLENHEITLSLVDSTSTVSGIDYDNAEAWKKAVGEDKLPKIMYATKGSNDYSDTFTPTQGGTFVAKIEVDGNAVTRDFGIASHGVTVYLGTANVTANIIPGTVVTLTANTYESKVFEVWECGALELADKNEATTTFVMPNSDVVLEAKFLNCYSVIVNADSVHVDAPEMETSNVTVTLPTTPEGTRFVSWTAVGVTLTPEQQTATSFTFTMPSNKVVLTANFVDIYAVTIINGSATQNVMNGFADVDSTVTIQADASTNDIRFKCWEGDGVIFADSTSANTTFVMPACAVTITAVYDTGYVVTVTEGSATNGVNSSNKAFVGDTITIAADTKEGFRFDHWTGTGITFDDPSSATTTFTMLDNAVTVTANYVRLVAIPTASTQNFTYNGAQHTYTLGNTSGSAYYTVSGNKQTNADEYTVTATLTDTTNTEWEDGTTEPKTYTFTIAPMRVPKPIADTRTFMENGKEQTFYAITQLGEDKYNFDGLFYNVSGNKQTKAGNYTVTVTVADNFIWADGTDETLTFNFEIKSNVVNNVKQMNAFIYYVKDRNDDIVDVLPLSYCVFNKENPIAEEKISSYYTPYLYGAPAGAKATFYISETPAKTNSIKWEDVTVDYLASKGGRSWFIYADITCPGYAPYTTPIQQSSVVYVESIAADIYSNKKFQYTKTEYDYVSPFSDTMSGLLNAMVVPIPKKVTVTEIETKKSMAFSRMTDAIEQIIYDLEHGYCSVQMLDWSTGNLVGFSPDKVSQLKSLLKSNKSAPRAMMARLMLLSDSQSHEFDLNFVEGLCPGASNDNCLIGDSFDPELTPKIKESNVDLQFEQALYSSLIDLGDPVVNEFEVKFDYAYVDPNNNKISYRVTKKYELGEALKAEDIPTREGFVFLGWYYVKPEEVVEIEPGETAPKQDSVGEQGEQLEKLDYVNSMIYFDPETDVVTGNITLYARWMNIEEYNKAKSEALTALDALNNADPLTDSTVLTDAKTAINAAQTIEEIEELKATALADIATKQAQELANAKEDAIAAVNAENDKAPINKAEILEAEVDNINAATTKAEVETAKVAGIATVQERQKIERTTMIVIIVVVVVVLGATVACFVLYKKGILFGKKKSEVEVVETEEVIAVAHDKQEKWVEEDREYLAHHAMHVTEDENGEYVVGVFFRHRRHKLYWFKYDEVDFELGEVAQYQSVEGDMRDVVVAIPKIRKDMSGHEHELKSLCKKN